MNTPTVYWLWHSGSYSALHRRHPRYPHMTWCGAHSQPSPLHGIAHTFTSTNVPGRIRPQRKCQECFVTMLHNPIFLLPFEPEDVQRAVKAKRQAQRETQYRDLHSQPIGQEQAA